MRASKRVRWPATIKARVLAIVAVPSLAILVVGACLFGYLINDGVGVRNFAEDVRGALGPTTRFVAGVQEERRLTLQNLSQPTPGRVDLDQRRREVDAALTDMSAATAQLAQNADMRPFRLGFTRAAGQLRDLRQRVDTGQASAEEIYAFYNRLLDRVGATIQRVARSSADSQVGFEQMIAYNLFTSAEAMSQAHAMAMHAVTGGLDPDQLHELAHQMGAYRQQFEALAPQMTPEEQSSYTALKASPAWQQLTSDDDFVMNHDDDVQPNHGRARGMAVPFNVTDWDNAAHQVSQALMGLYVSHSTHAADMGAASGRRALVTSVLLAVGVLLVVAAVLLVALRLSARLIRRLTRLRQETLDLADRRLPELVRRLSDGEPINLETEVPWLDHGEDEIGQVANAFNAAQRSAIAATVREAETRQGVRAVFLNIAHRTQVIVHRQLKVLDQAERALEDPAQLKLLFQLDHLATRGRRNAENLIILGGGQAGRQWRNPVALREVVRSAIAETEHFMRVNAIRLPDVALAGAVVADLIHLLAELVDNATAFSPPHSLIEVRGNGVARGVVIEIEDQGLGIEPDQLERLNGMLHDPPDFSVMALSEEPRIGLFVVARLAARHGIKVTLRESVYDGTRATVLIPTDALAGPSAPEAPPWAPALPAAGDQRALTWHASELTADLGQRLPALVRAPVAVRERTVNGRSPVGGGGASVNGSAQPNGSTEATVRTQVRPGETNGETTSNGWGRSNDSSGPAEPAGSAGSNGSVDTADPAETDHSADTGESAKANDSAKTGRSAEAQAPGSTQLAPLPRRARQRNLAPQLLTDPADGIDAEDDSAPARTPEHSRSTMTAFQQGTRRARAGEPESAPDRAEARVDEDDDGQTQRR